LVHACTFSSIIIQGQREVLVEVVEVHHVVGRIVAK
jgi:hypothetical protein